MHDIEKQVLVEKIFQDIWKLYAIGSIFETQIEYSNIMIPKLKCICKGIGAAGTYYPGSKTVEINTAYYNGGATVNLETTIAHEIAHHITNGIFPHATQWHGPEFRMIMQSIGYDGNTYHSMSRQRAKKVAQRSKDELFDL